MQSPDNKVDMAEMNAAIDKVLAIPAGPKAKQKERRTQRKARHPLSSPPAQACKNSEQPVVR